MNFQEAEELITTTFKTAWGATTPVAWDDVQKIPEQGKEFVRLVVRYAAGRQRTLGSSGTRQFGYDGVLMIQVNTPKGASGQRNRELVRRALTIFEDANIGIWFLNGHPETVGEDGKGYYVTNVVFDLQVRNVS
jgi:hypothetical protein